MRKERSSAGIDVFEFGANDFIPSQTVHNRLSEVLFALFAPTALLKAGSLNQKIAAVSTAEWLDTEGWRRPSKRTQAEATDLVGSVGWLPQFGDPNITSSIEGRIVFEWWQGERKLTLYVGETGYEFIKVWGADMDSEMEDGFATDLVSTVRLLLWLHGG